VRQGGVPGAAATTETASITTAAEGVEAVSVSGVETAAAVNSS